MLAFFLLLFEPSRASALAPRQADAGTRGVSGHADFIDDTAQEPAPRDRFEAHLSDLHLWASSLTATRHDDASPAESWPVHYVPRHGICSSGWLKGMKEASWEQCQDSCAGSSCQYYCYGGMGAPRGACLQYTECESLYLGKQGEELSAYTCYQRSASGKPAVKPPASGVPSAATSAKPSQWSQHLAPLRGFCSSGFIGGSKHAAERDCQADCAGSRECRFYCHADRSCLKYSQCDSLRTERNGQNMSSFACYAKPAGLSFQSTPSNIAASPQASSRYLAPSKGICSSGYISGAKAASRSACGALCEKAGTCKFFCHASKTSPLFQCMLYTDCPSLLETNRAGHNVSEYSCYRASDDIGAVTHQREQEVPQKQMLRKIDPTQRKTKMSSEAMVENASHSIAEETPWPRHFEPATGFCTSGFLQGTPGVSQAQCQSVCNDRQDCNYYCHAGKFCLQYSECTSMRGTRSDGKDMSEYVCRTRPSIVSLDRENQTEGPDKGNRHVQASDVKSAEANATKAVGSSNESTFANKANIHTAAAANENKDNVTQAPAGLSGGAGESNATKSQSSGASVGNVSRNTDARAGRMCGIAWLYEIPGCADFGHWADELRARGDVDEVVRLTGTGPGEARLDEDSYRAFQKEHLGSVLAAPKGKLLAVVHGRFAPAPGGWLNKSWETLKHRLQAQGCDLVRATILRDPVERTSAVAKPGQSILSNDTELSTWLVNEMERKKFLDNGMTRYLLNNNKEADSGREREPFSMPLGAVNDTAARRALSVLRAFEYVGFAEELHTELLRLEVRLGLGAQASAEATPAPTFALRESVRTTLSQRLLADSRLFELAYQRFSPQAQPGEKEDSAAAGAASGHA